MQSGAGGNWKRSHERHDDAIIQQISDDSCMAAVGQMLLRTRGIDVPQAKISDIIGEPAASKDLAEALNQFDKGGDGKTWSGEFLDDFASLRNLFEKVEPGCFAVILREPPSSTGHAVMLAGILDNGLLEIEDPYDQTSYKMTIEDFDDHWGLEVIALWEW